MPLSVYDFRDLDLLIKLAEETDTNGGISTKDLADALGLAEEDRRSVGIRCSWMRRYGMLEFDKELGLWDLSESGERVTRARLRASAETVISNVPDESLVEVMAHVTTRYRLGDPVMATLLRREFLYGTSPRSRIWNASR